MSELTTLVVFLVFCQALGALVGTVTAIWSELSYVKALRDGKIDSAERKHLIIIGHGLRYGLTVLLLSSLGLVVLAYIEHAAIQPALSSSYWTLVVLALVVIVVSSSLARKRVSFIRASAILFTAWWFLVYLSFGWLALSFGATIMFFIVATIIFYAVLHYSRSIILH